MKLSYTDHWGAKCQPDGLIDEKARVHFFQIRAHDWFEVHLIQHVFLKINARRDFDQLKPFFGKLEDSPFSDIQHRLAILLGLLTARR